MRASALSVSFGLLSLAACSGDSSSTQTIADGGSVFIDGAAGASGLGGSGGAAGLGGGGAAGAGGLGGGSSTEGIAPPTIVPEATEASDGPNDVNAGAGNTIWMRVDVHPGEHVRFFLEMDPASADVVMYLERYVDGDLVPLGLTDAGPGLRTLAVFETTGISRTHFVRLEATDAFSGELTITRTPFEDRPDCPGDCDRLMQLPLPIDPTFDGYDWDSGTIMRYQFGRRDLLMFFRHAARSMAAAGFAPVFPEDFSQWDGQTPGTDTGNLRHASHQRGKDVDISLYGTDGLAPWRSYCDTIRDESPSSVDGDGTGRECVPGTVTGYDARTNARLFAPFFATGRVTHSFLDQELIDPTIVGASDAAAAGEIDPVLVPLYSDGKHLQHWPNHDNHIHLRVSEDPYDASGAAYHFPDDDLPP